MITNTPHLLTPKPNRQKLTGPDAPESCCPWIQIAYKGDWRHGTIDMTPDDRLRECVYKALSVPDKIKYIEEIRTTANYEMQIERWQKGNRSGPRPLKPGTTHQDRFESKLQTAKRVIETQVRQSMTEDERNAYDCAKALCEKQIAAKSDYHFFYWPDEIIQYNKRIARATGLKTESEEVFFRRN